MVRRLCIVYLEKLRKIVCIIRVGIRVVFEEVFYRRFRFVVDVSFKVLLFFRGVFSWSLRIGEGAGWVVGFL